MVIRAYSSYQQGKAGEYQQKQNAAIARHNALLAERDARAAEIDLQEEQWLHLWESEQALGTARVAAGASGAATYVGAPFMIRAQMASMFDWERQTQARKGRAKIEDYRQEAASQKMQAKGYRVAARNARTTGALGAGSAIFSGLASGVRQGYWGQSKTA